MQERRQSINVLEKVLTEKQSLTNALSQTICENKNVIQAWCYGILRTYFSLSEITNLLIKKPLKKKDHDILYLVYIALFQLRTNSAPEYAIVSETVESIKNINKKWAAGLVNAILRTYIRDKTNIENKINKKDIAKYDHPKWLIEKIKNAWSIEWEAILNENNQQPPMWLRVNQQKLSTDDYLKKLDNAASKHPKAPSALLLNEPKDVKLLPGFEEGLVSVQDLSAQLAIKYLDIKAGHRILDACAAPGGKACHILETESDIDHLDIVEIDATRAKQIEENLSRLQLKKNYSLHIADATKPNQWHDRQLYDRILIDAPCSSTGVIRRHPDIKLLRQASDIKKLCELQRELLASLWPLLKPDGVLVYATCSVLPEENTEQIHKFIAQTPGSKLLYEKQLFPQHNGGDGFYYAVVV